MKLLLGCYRTGDATDPEVYTGAVIAVFSDYPDDVIEQVVDPRVGLPSKLQWLPTIAEIKSACEEIEGPRRWAREWDAGVAKQIEALKTEALLLDDGRTPEQRAAHVAAMREEAHAKLGVPLRKGARAHDGDGRHAERVAADLAARAERRRQSGEAA